MKTCGVNLFIHFQTSWDCIIDVWEWISNFTQHFTLCVYLSMLGLKLNHVSKRRYWSQEKWLFFRPKLYELKDRFDSLSLSSFLKYSFRNPIHAWFILYFFYPTLEKSKEKPWVSCSYSHSLPERDKVLYVLQATDNYYQWGVTIRY